MALETHLAMNKWGWGLGLHEEFDFGEGHWFPVDLEDLQTEVNKSVMPTYNWNDSILREIILTTYAYFFLWNF